MTESPELAPADGAASRQRGELYLLVLLLAAGSGAVLLLANRAWLTVHVARPAPFGPLALGVTGRHIYPPLAGLAVVGLLAALLALFTGRWVRQLLGLLVGLGSVAVIVTGFRFLFDAASYRHRDLIGDRAGLGAQAQTLGMHSVWAGLTVLAAVLTLASGALLMIRARQWSSGLGRRYAAPAEAAQAADPWRQLDRGEDPTVDNG